MRWSDRIEVEEAARIVRAALAGEWLDGHRAVLFHDLGRMRDRIAHVHRLLPGALHAVAIKANPIVEVLRDAVGAGAGLEAASIEEVHLALAAGCAPERIVFDSPAKTLDELREALALGVVLNADNLAELARIAEVGPGRARVGLRVNPEVGVGRIAATSVAGRSSKFGEPIGRAVVEAFARWPWLTGLHVHVGSQGCGVDLLVEAARRAAALRREIEAAGGHVARVDVGGGLPVAYRTGDPVPDPSEWLDGIRRQAPELLDGGVQIVTELGRSVQAPCGLAASRVEYVKRAGDQALAVVHLGADLLLRPVYAPADWSHEVAVLGPDGRPKAGPTSPVTVAGPLCFGGDLIARDRSLPAVEPDDWLLIRDVGAYTVGMWSRHCSRGLPRVLGRDGEAFRVLRERETPADVVAFWSGPDRG